MRVLYVFEKDGDVPGWESKREDRQPPGREAVNED